MGCKFARKSSETAKSLNFPPSDQIKNILASQKSFKAFMDQIYQNVDANNDGKVDMKELEIFIQLFDQTLEERTHYKSNWTPQMIEKLVKDTDLDKDKIISKGEMGILVQHLLRSQLQLIEKDK